MGALTLDAEILVTLNHRSVPTLCVMGVGGVCYMSGALCKELGLKRSPLKKSKVYTTFYDGERVKNLAIAPELHMQFPSGYGFKCGPWIVDDSSPVDLHIGGFFLDDTTFATQSGGYAINSAGLLFVSNPNVGVYEPLKINTSNERLLALVPPPDKNEECAVCGLAAAGLRQCARCKGVRYCSRTCQEKHWPSHKQLCKRSKEDTSAPAARDEGASHLSAAEVDPNDHSLEGREPAIFSDTDVLCTLVLNGLPIFELCRGDASVDDAVVRTCEAHGLPRHQKKSVGKKFRQFVVQHANELRYCDSPKLGDLMLAVALYTRACPNSDALFQLGLAYRDGIGMRVNLTVAAELFEKAALSGKHAGAAINLGALYAEGKGLCKDMALAVKYFQIAADRYVMNACLDKDPDNWYEKAKKNLIIAEIDAPEQYACGQAATPSTYRAWAAAGDNIARYHLSQILLKGTCGESPNFEQARQLVEKSAEERYGEAVVFLGSMYQQDNERNKEQAAKLVIDQDFRRAVELYSEGERQGMPIAMHNLARMYQFGQGVAHDHARAMQLFRAASKKGREDSMVNLAGMLLQLSDEPSDYQEAVSLLREAAGKGQNMAKQLLEQLDQEPSAGQGKGTGNRGNRTHKDGGKSKGKGGAIC